MIVFKRGDLVIRETEHTDLMPIAFNMRQADCNEIWASSNLMPLEALEKGTKFSRPCLTAELKGKPIAMFGLVPTSPIAATIWFLGTPEVDSISICFGRLSKLMVLKFLKMYPSLQNYVDVRNKKSIEWLKWLGAKFSDPEPYGVMQQMFQFFTLQKGLTNV